MLGSLKDLGKNAMDAVSDGVETGKKFGEKGISDVYLTVGEGIDKTKEIGQQLGGASVEAYNSINVIPESTKEQVLNFIENNKELIAERVARDLDGIETEDLVLSLIHGMLPFPLGLLIPEAMFIEYGKKNKAEIVDLVTIIISSEC